MPTTKKLLKKRKKSPEERRIQRQRLALEIFNRSVCAVHPAKCRIIVVSSGLAYAIAKGGKMASLDMPGYQNSKESVALGVHICRVVKDRKFWCVAVREEPLN